MSVRKTINMHILNWDQAFCHLWWPIIDKRMHAESIKMRFCVGARVGQI